MRRPVRLTLAATLLLIVTVGVHYRLSLDAPMVRRVMVDFCEAAALFGVVYTLVATALMGRFFCRNELQTENFPPVSVIKPLCGFEHSLLENLSSFCQQDYPGSIQYIFGVNDDNDPALAVVDELRRRFPDADVTVVASPRLYGPNRKVSNTLNMLPQAKYELLVFADSDVGVSPRYLRSLVAELQKPETSLVTCLYQGVPDPGLWPRLSAMATDYQFLPSAITGMALGMATPCFGQTIAIRRKTLEQIGGFEMFTHHLAEDYAIGRAVRKLGGKVAVPAFAVSHACCETSLGQLIAHELRWSRTIQTVDPIGHLGSALIHPFAFAVLAVLISGGSTAALVVAAIALATRLFSKFCVDLALRRMRGGYFLLPMFDLLSFGIFAASFLSTRITWRGHRFNVDSNGMLLAASTNERQVAQPAQAV